MASSSGPRSSVERYSEPSKRNLIAFTRLALTAKVAQPMITPIKTPAMKPNLHDQNGDGEQRGIFERRDAPCRIDQPLIHQARAEIEQKAAEHEFRHVGEEARIEQQHQARDHGDDQAANPAAPAGRIGQRGAAERDAAHIAAERGSRHIGEAERLQLAPEIGLAPRHELDAGGVEQHGDGGHEHHGEDVGAEPGEETPGEVAHIAEIPGRRESDGGRGLEGPAELKRLAEARSGERESEMGEYRGDQQHGGEEERASRAAQHEIERKRDG